MIKEYRVVISYDVHKTFYVKAKDEEQAYDKAYEWEGDTNRDAWEYRDHIETVKIKESDQ